MGVYLFNKEVLDHLLWQDHQNSLSSHDFGKDILLLMIQQGMNVHSFPFSGYWVDVGTVESYWQAHMDLLVTPPPIDLNDRSWIIHTRTEERPPVWIASGAQVAGFERVLSDYVGGRPVRSFTSATGAMEVALQLLGIGAGDEVITPAQSFFASANVIERVGARVVFVDVEPVTRNVDLAAAAAAVTPRTKALLPVHYNAPLDAGSLAAFRARHGVRILDGGGQSRGVPSASLASEGGTTTREAHVCSL